MMMMMMRTMMIYAVREDWPHCLWGLLAQPVAFVASNDTFVITPRSITRLIIHVIIVVPGSIKCDYISTCRLHVTSLAFGFYLKSSVFVSKR